jgi:cardiolipin synthase
MVDRRTSTTNAVPDDEADAVGDDPRGTSHFNLPNFLCVVRLFAAAGMLLCAVNAATGWFLGLLVLALLTDWLDGKLAIWLNQRTVFGARLDSTADAAMYGALLVGTLLLKAEFLRHETAWIVLMVGSYGVTSMAGLLKFGRIPSYHTRAAKTGWLLVSIAAITVFADGPAWPFRVAMSFVALTNLEATAITLVLRQWRADVPTLFHAIQRRHSTN